MAIFQTNNSNVYYFLLTVSIFYKFCVFPKYYKYLLVPGVFYSAQNSRSRILFASKHDDAIIHGMARSSNFVKVATSSLRVNKEQLRWNNAYFLVLNFSDYTQAVTTRRVPGIGFSNFFSGICGLQFMVSTMLIDNNQAELLIISMIQFIGCIVN